MKGPVDPTVAWLTFRQLLIRRRIVAAVVFSLAPAAIALLYSTTHRLGDVEPPAFLVNLYREIVVGTLLPLAAVVLGTAAFGGEIDDGTIVYLLVKPLPRWRVVLSKYAVAVLSTAAVMAPAVVLPWLVIGPGVTPGAIPLAFAAGIGLGVVLYCALFTLFGLTSRRALVLGLLYIVTLEFVMSREVAGVRSLSIREFVLTIAGKLAAGQAGVPPGSVSLATVWTMGGVILVGGLALTIRRLWLYEVAERL